MEKVRDLFTEFGADTFKVLNGQDIGGTGASDSNKSQQNNSRSNIASVIKADDGNSFVFCVSDGKWAVYPPEPMKNWGRCDDSNRCQWSPLHDDYD